MRVVIDTSEFSLINFLTSRFSRSRVLLFILVGVQAVLMYYISTAIIQKCWKKLCVLDWCSGPDRRRSVEKAFFKTHMISRLEGCVKLCILYLKTLYRTLWLSFLFALKRLFHVPAFRIGCQKIVFFARRKSEIGKLQGEGIAWKFENTWAQLDFGQRAIKMDSLLQVFFLFTVFFDNIGTCRWITHYTLLQIIVATSWVELCGSLVAYISTKNILYRGTTHKWRVKTRWAFFCLMWKDCGWTWESWSPWRAAFDPNPSHSVPITLVPTIPRKKICYR
jgi:hypothetical protein